MLWRAISASYDVAGNYICQRVRPSQLAAVSWCCRDAVRNAAVIRRAMLPDWAGQAAAGAGADAAKPVFATLDVATLAEGIFALGGQLATTISAHELMARRYRVYAMFSEGRVWRENK